MQILLLLQARRRRLWHVCPAFFVYTAFQIVKAAVLFTVSDPKAYKLYFVAYWTGEVIDVLLVVAVLYQLYSLLFLGYEGLRVLQDVLFRWATAVCVLIAVTVAASVPGADSSRLLAGLLAVHVGAAILKAGLIIFAMVMSSALALRWNHYAFGALVGFALYNTVELAAGAARVNLGMIASGPYRLISPAAYSCGMLVWVAYFFSKEKEPVPLKSVPENSLAAWNQALLELLTK
ncbi:MAG: hypothetical protein LAN64_11025 [Acidobacteriia bacterium]|nr:hypothetical protein [Terriglobia bacterium]